MAEVAAEAGMSSGSVFTYVTSKEALFHLVFAYGFGHFDEVLPSLPLATPAPGETFGLIEQGVRKVTRAEAPGRAGRGRSARCAR